MMNGIHFAHPWFFLLFLAIPLLIVWYWFKHKKSRSDLSFSSLSLLGNLKKSFRVKFIHSLFVIRLLVLSLIIIAIARPQKSLSKKELKVEGIDIIMTMDISGTMLAEDFIPNRLEAAKEVAMNFISSRPNDRIGLVVFSGEAFTQCPLTGDHAVLFNLFSAVKYGMIDDGTAIGDALATSVNRLKSSKAISKVIILLTDGINNTGSIDPKTAADIAKLFGIRVYTIGVGSEGMAKYPFQNMGIIQYQNIKVEIDEELLKNIAQTTNGKYFRATDKNKLELIYQEIDKLEKSKIDVTEYQNRKEMFLPFIILACFLLLLEILLKNTYFRTIP
jgi:Ca-activated chloride channel family protein